MDYQQINNCSKVTIDNVRRNISSFFSWLEEEDYILKSPMRRIHKIRSKTVVKEVITDETIEIKHTAFSKKVFAVGAINAAVWLSEQNAGIYSMKDMI